MKIQSVKIKNFRNIIDLEKEINGANIILLADNGLGKSNFIKALEACLGLKERIGVAPITDGEKFGYIEVDMAEGDKRFEFKLEFEEGKDPVLKVKQPDGLSTKTKSIIGGLVGEIDFDIDEFVQMSASDKGRKQQIEIFKSYLPEDLKISLAKHENHIKNLYEDRTQVNKDLVKLQGAIKTAQVTEKEKETYFLKKPTEAIDKKLATAVDANKTRQQGITAMNLQQTELDKKVDQAKRNVLEIERMEIEIEKLKIQNKELGVAGDAYVKKIAEINTWLKDNPEIDITATQAELKECYEHNKHHERITAYRKQEEELEQTTKEAENLTIQIETSRDAIRTAIKEIDSPVDGLSYNEDTLTYQERPVDVSTMSTSEIMMLGVKMKIAKNPKAHVLFIQRGESMGIQKLKDLQAMAKEYDMQIIMEMVKPGQQEMIIEFMPEY